MIYHITIKIYMDKFTIYKIYIYIYITYKW